MLIKAAQSGLGTIHLALARLTALYALRLHLLTTSSLQSHLSSPKLLVRTTVTVQRQASSFRTSVKPLRALPVEATVLARTQALELLPKGSRQHGRHQLLTCSALSEHTTRFATSHTISATTNSATHQLFNRPSFRLSIRTLTTFRRHHNVRCRSTSDCRRSQRCRH